MKIFFVAGGALILGFVLGVAFNAAYIRHLRRQVRELRTGQKRERLKHCNLSANPKKDA